MGAFGFSMARPGPATPSVRAIAGHRITAEYASTPSEQRLGLSGRDSLAPDTALVFPFSPASTPTFWMKDMRFPIDIVWVAGQRVVGIDPSVPADDGARRYAPAVPVDEVFELPAGWCVVHGVAVGDRVE